MIPLVIYICLIEELTLTTERTGFVRFFFFFIPGWRYTVKMNILFLLRAICSVSSPLSLCCFQGACSLFCYTKEMFKAMVRGQARNRRRLFARCGANASQANNTVVSGGLSQSQTMPDDRILEVNAGISLRREAAGQTKVRSRPDSARSRHVCSSLWKTDTRKLSVSWLGYFWTQHFPVVRL